MRSKPEFGPIRRRRGKVLEDAILAAAWETMLEGGYETLTLEAVAKRAGTSRPVIARRWPDRVSLLMAAIRQVMAQTQPEPANTGTLRGDLLATLEMSNTDRTQLASLILVQLAPYYRESGVSPAQLRRQVLSDSPQAIDLILRRADQRGEIDRSALTPRMISVAFDLVWQEMLVTLNPVPRSVLVQIVDDIYIPLLKAASSRA